MALANRPPGAAILLSHSPLQAGAAAAAGAGLMLSGHTHDGQIWPFGYLVRLSYPLLGGRYEVDGMPVIVCRGTGTWGPRMRLWRPSEILRITLRSGLKDAAKTRARRAPGRRLFAETRSVELLRGLLQFVAELRDRATAISARARWRRDLP